MKVTLSDEDKETLSLIDSTAERIAEAVCAAPENVKLRDLRRVVGVTRWDCDDYTFSNGLIRAVNRGLVHVDPVRSVVSSPRL